MGKNKIIIVLVLILSLLSCNKEVIAPNQPPLPPQPIITDTTIIDNALSIVGKKLVMVEIKTNFTSFTTLNDTLSFITKDKYVKNNDTLTYHLYPTMYAYNLTLYETTWGNLSGVVYEQTVLGGEETLTKFTNIIDMTNNIYIIRLKFI